MKAAIAEKGKLEIRDIPKPIPRFESALVRIISAGVCHSDIHLMKGDWSGSFPPYAIPLGHEGIGIVEELGTGAEQFVKVGDRVIMGLGGSGGRYWCGACKHCLSGKNEPMPAREAAFRHLRRIHLSLGEIVSATARFGE